MKNFRSYLTTLDRSATAQSRKFDRKQLFRALLATTFIAGSQLLSANSAFADSVPTPAQPSPLLPTRFILNGNFEDTQVTNWVGPYSNSSPENFVTNSWNEYHKTSSDYSSKNPDPMNLRYGSTTSYSSTLGQSGNNIATANVRKGYNETAVNPAAKPVIWLTSETGEFRSLWNYSDSIEIFRGDCSQSTSQGNITTPSRSSYNPCGEKSAPKPLVAGNAVNGTTATNGTADSPTNQFAEIQGSALATLYQDIYVFPGETVNWSLRHAARNVNPGTAYENQTNIMQVSITDPSPDTTNLPKWSGVTPPINQANAYYSSKGDYSPLSDNTDPKRYPTLKASPSLSDPITSARPFIATTVNEGWKKYQGSWLASNASPKLMRFGFTAIQGSRWGVTGGNFIDDVDVKLKASADFLPTDGTRNVNLETHTEGNTPNYYYLSLRINGKTSGGTITISMTGLNVPTSSTPRTFSLGTVLKGSAAVTGMSATKNGNDIVLTIPAGTYNPNLPSDYIHIPIDFSNTVPQLNNNLVFTLSGQTGDLMVQPSPGNVSGMGRLSVATSLIDDDVVAPVEPTPTPTPTTTPTTTPATIKFQKKVELPIKSPVRIAAN